jgi:hypothetical protein
MKFKFFLSSLIMFSTLSYADYTLEDVKKMRNDKEVFISSITEKDQKRIDPKYRDLTLVKRLSESFYKTVQSFVNQESKHCELTLIDALIKNAAKDGIKDEDSFEEYLQALRVNNAIDDLLYDILSSLNEDYYGLKELDLTRIPKRSKLSSDTVKANDLKELFSGFAEFPDEKDRCFFQEYMFVSNNTRNAKGKKDDDNIKLFRGLTSKAYEEKIISLATYNKMAYLQTESQINDRSIWVNDYLKIVLNAKNKMVPLNYKYQPVKLEDEDMFASLRVKRLGITRRELLYRKYDATQIVLLAQVIQKASRRMGVDADTDTQRPSISQEFTVNGENGERRTYVEVTELDPQSQFNLARRMMRKDMIELQMMDIFLAVKITHEDLVMAALETGYLSLEELSYVLKYDDLWNPHKSKFEKVSGFVMEVAGYGSFLLPPPWNIVASVAIGIVEGIIEGKERKGTDNDNPGSIVH